ncbi:hypothetical protein ACUTAF_01920 [Pseudomonas sp. SP16.1]|uniref:hypothetical protein n=1 Tax=Pseudomonas sp. SP16.1 TaxID=3458854 RepID=UPI004045EBC8
MSALPKTHTQKMFIAARRCFPTDPYEIALYGFDPSTGSNALGYIVLGTAEVTVDIPECNPVQAEIAAIEKARDQILADAQLQATQLNERIQRLLCIEHEVPE